VNALIEIAEKAMNNNCSEKFWSGRVAHSVVRSMLAAFAVLAASGIVSAQDTKDEISFSAEPGGR